jgi:hypothetical protein
MLTNLQHSESKRACWSSGMGTRTNDKEVNYSHGFAQTKQQVGSCVVEALLVHKQTINIHRFTRLTTTRIERKSSPSPL